MIKTADGGAGEPGNSKPGSDDGCRPEACAPHRQLGHYEVLEKIGQGGMAVVYKGIQPSLNRAVAIKVLPPQFVSTPELLGRFDREASIVSQLNHSNIVQVIDRGKEGDTLYIVMEYVDGESLDQVIRRGLPDTATILEYATQICDGLEYAHSMGVVHRDLKPSNLLIDRRSGRVKIADFGIAQLETTGGAVATLTFDGVSIGTMNYMSPEQRLDAHTVTHLTDIFSFGVILYQMLTGKLPIGHFKAPSSLRPDLPLGLDAIVRKCLAEAPSDRYQNAGEIRRELAKLTRLHHKIEKSAILSISRLNKRQRWRALGAAAGGLLALLVVCAAVRAARRSPTAAPAPSEVAPPRRPAADGAAPGVAAPSAEKSAPAPAAVAVAPPSGKGSASSVDARVRDAFAHAEGLAAGGRPREAADVLSELLVAYPDSPRAPGIQLAIADAYYAMGEKERCKTEYERLVRKHPVSDLVPRAIVGRCRAEWDTLPRRGLLRAARDADAQRRLIEELTVLAADPAAHDALPSALRLIAEIAEAPELSNPSLAAETLVRVHRLAPGGDSDALFRASEILDRKRGDPVAALASYRSFLDAFPSDGRVEAVRRRIGELETAAAPKPQPARHPATGAAAP